MARSQVLRERKKQRRVERKRRRAAAPRDDARAEDEPIIVITTGGRSLTENELPTSRLSDPLTALVEQYLPWPWTQREMELARSWLLVVASVWNLTVATDPREQCRLMAAIERLASTLEVADVPLLVEAIAARKRQLFPADLRWVVDVSVTAEAGRAVVRTASAWYTR